MSQRRAIVGSGKGGEEPTAPREHTDSLRSRAFARVLDLVAEGEIVGLVDGARSIYLNETVLENADGSRNFMGVTYEQRVGTQAQTYIPDASAVESELVVGVPVLAATPVVRTVSNASIDAVRVRLSFPRLTFQDLETGDITGTTVQLAIDVQSNGGGYVTKVQDTITGKASSKYERSYYIGLAGSAPWDIRVRRITPDSTLSNLSNASNWETYTEIIEAKLRYPNSAMIGLSVDSAQFSSVPRRAYDLKLLKVRVPANYDPIARTYTGVWDGTFQIAWTDNPAWHFFDLCTTERYGLGEFLDLDQVDKWGLYTIAQYCDQLVEDGRGGLEPRFTCNVYLQTRAEAFKVLQDLAGVFRAMAFSAGGVLMATQDAPRDPSRIYTNTNVVDSTFEYQGSGRNARHTVAVVIWNDPTDFYRQKREYVEDEAGILRYGVKETEVVAVGCVSQGQARRVGRHLLYSERMETETVTFRVGLEGAVALPGEVALVSDRDRAGVRYGGRVAAGATTGNVPLDSTVTLDAGATYSLSTVQPNGTVEERPVTSAPGVRAALTVSPAFTSAPSQETVWLLRSSVVEPTTWRVLSATENDKHDFLITALAHEPLKYAAVENGVILQARQTSVISNQPPAPPANVVVSESLYMDAGKVRVMVSISWEQVDGAVRYAVDYTRAGDNPVSVSADSNSVELRDALPGQYTVFVRAQNSLGRSSPAASVTQQVSGLAGLPSAPTNVALAVVASNARLTWDDNLPLDVRVDGQIVIRFTNIDNGSAQWVDGFEVRRVTGNNTETDVPLMRGTYMLKSVDQLGNFSSDTAMVISGIASVIVMNVVATTTQEPGWTGTKTNVVKDGAIIKLDSSTLIDSILVNIDSYLQNIDSGVVPTGTYLFSNTVDLGAVYISRLTASMRALVYDTDEDLDSRTTPIDEWGMFDGDEITDANAELWVRTTRDDPAGAPVWTEWQRFFVGDYQARAFQFKLVLTSGDPTHQVEVHECTVSVDMPDRVEAAHNVAVGTGGLAVTYANAFNVAPSLGINPKNLATGDFWTITLESATGFTIIFKNAAGAGVARTMDWMAKGYGYKT